MPSSSPMTSRRHAASFGACAVVFALMAPVANTLAAQAGTPVSPAPDRSQTTRRVWEGSWMELASASPDGRFVANLDEQYGNMWVRDVLTGKTRAITGNTSYSTWTGTAWSSVFSPDGKALAYVWSDFAARRTEIRIGGVDSTPPRIVYPGDSTSRSVNLEDWTSDGAYLAAVLMRADASSQLLLIPTAGGAPRVIRTFLDWIGPTNVRVSPDGRHIAYALPVSKRDGRRDVHVLSVAENRDQVVARHDADDVVLGWSADGGQLAFSSDRAGSPGVWSVAMSGGRPVGDPRLVRGDLWRMLPLRLTASGRVFYVVAAGDRLLNVASFDAATGRLRSAPAGFSPNAGEPAASARWSPDGGFLAWLSWTGDNGRVGTTRLIIKSVENGDIRTMAPPVGYLQRFEWMPDGRSLLLHARDARGDFAVHLLDLASGDVRTIAGVRTNSAVPSADGRAIYYVGEAVPGQPASNRRRLVEHILATGKERDVYVAPQGFEIGNGYSRFEPNLRVTRDGRSIAFVLNQSPTLMPSWVATVPVAGGPARILTDSAAHRQFTNIRLVGQDPEGSQLLFTTRRSLGPDTMEEISAWSVPVAGGAATRLSHPSDAAADGASECPYPCSLSVSPDGRKVAFTSGESRQELWMLDDPSLRVGAAKPAPGRRR